MKIPIIHIDKNKFQIDIDLGFYSVEAINSASYKFTDKYYIYHHLNEEKSAAIVTFESMDNTKFSETDIKKYCNELIDQQLRCNINKQFGHIRDMIVEEAFKPITDR